MSLSERTLFHRVILIKLSEPMAKCLQGFSLGNRLAGGRSFPFSERKCHFFILAMNTMPLLTP